MPHCLVNLAINKQSFIVSKARVKDNFHIVYLGEAGFPFGMAAIQKMTLISKALVHNKCKVTVINYKARFDSAKKIALPPKGVFEGIHYVYTSGNIYKSKNFIVRNWDKLKGTVNEFILLYQFKKEGDLKGAIISSENFARVLLYYMYGKILSFPLIINYVEMLSSMQHRESKLTRLNDYLLDRFLIKRMDAAIPISKLLAENFKKIAPNKASFKIPVLCDFEKFQISKKTQQDNYFLYCGALDYIEVVDFILNAYNELDRNTSYKLYLLVSNGLENQYAALQQKIAQLKNPQAVKVFKNIPYTELVELYVNAKALLIPLRPTVQDTARFPHKIGEYCASKNPIITTNYGEVKNYFTDQQNALIANEYELLAFAEKMQFVIDHPKAAIEIGKRGYELGLENFNYLKVGKNLKAFIEQLQDSPATKGEALKSKTI